MKKLRDERGGVLALTALSLAFVLLPMLALGIDAGNLYYTQRQLQTLADSTAMAAALEASACKTLGINPCAAMTTAASKAFAEDNPPAGATYVIHNPPSALGSTVADPNYGIKTYVEAIVTMSTPTYFARVFGATTVTLSARAEAGYATSSSVCSATCMYTNNLLLNGNAKITGDNTNSGIYDGGSDMENTGSKVQVGTYNVQGSITDRGTDTVSPTQGGTQPDPILTEINNGTITAPTPSSTPSYQNSSTTLNSGYYPSGLTFSSGTTYTLNAGVYYMGSNVILNTGAVINGSGVTIYLANGVGINSNGSASTINLTAPSSGSQAGMLIWGAGNNTVNLDSGSSSSFGGAIYLPGSNGQLTLNGDSTATTYGIIDANSVTVDANVTLTIGSGGGGPANGSKQLSLAE